MTEQDPPTTNLTNFRKPERAMSANAAPHVLYGQRNDWHVQKVLVAANYAGMKLRLDDKTDAETVKQVRSILQATSYLLIR